MMILGAAAICGRWLDLIPADDAPDRAADARAVGAVDGPTAYLVRIPLDVSTLDDARRLAREVALSAVCVESAQIEDSTVSYGRHVEPVFCTAGLPDGGWCVLLAGHAEDCDGGPWCPPLGGPHTSFHVDGGDPT
jgi:hypothetical protein